MQRVPQHFGPGGGGALRLLLAFCSTSFDLPLHPPTRTSIWTPAGPGRILPGWGQDQILFYTGPETFRGHSPTN